MGVGTIDRDEIAIMLIDVQPGFLDGMHGDPQPLLARLEQLLIVANWFECCVKRTTTTCGRMPCWRCTN